MAVLEHILQYLDRAFEVGGFPDYSDAFNGLQLEGKGEVTRIGAAVDGSVQTIEAAVERGVDFLLVHHGLFWGGAGPLTGVRLKKVAPLVKHGTSLYSLHLPLDAHPDFGNNSILLRELGLEPEGRFGTFKDVPIGWWAGAVRGRDQLVRDLEEVLGEKVRVIPGGPERTERVGVLSGAGSSALSEAATIGLDSLITGEAPHHAFHDAMELGLNLFLAGHYATETFGVQAVAANLSDNFDVPWEFLHFPTGL